MVNVYDEKRRSISCESADRCGSCAYAGMKYDNELKIKQDYVDKLFKGVCPVEKITGMYRPVHYRNKVHAVVGEDKNGNIITGTYEENSHVIVPVSECMLEDSQCSKIIATLRDLFKSFKYKPYNEDKGTGFIRHILLRKGFSTKEIMLVLVTSEVAFPSKTHFLKALKGKHPEINTIVQNVNGYNTSMVLGPRNIVLTGKGYIEDVLCGYRFRISPSSFYQINHQQTEKLYKAAINMAGITKKDTVIDAYCGIGTIGIAASGKAGQVIGVELNAAAVKDAEENARLNNIKNIRFVNADAGEFLVEYARNKKADVVIMDPPRSGSSEDFLNSILKIKPDRVVYVSCNPDTQRRDVDVLIKGGYKVDGCRPFDMFPFTDNVETVCLLSKLHEAKHHVNVRLDMDELDITSAESKATYEEIKKYVAEHYDGMKVSNLYIAQVKAQYGIIERENYNKPKSDDARQPKCPKEKEEAIVDALRYFQMI